MKDLFARFRGNVANENPNGPQRQGEPSIQKDAAPLSEAAAHEERASSTFASVANEVPKRKVFGFMEGKSPADLGSSINRAPAADTKVTVTELRGEGEFHDHAPTAKRPSLLPGSDGEHRLQEKYATKDRALAFYDRQVLDYLAPAMRDFLSRQEFLFVATSDRYGECDCTSKFGEPGFIRVLSDKHLMYPEYRGNGVYANSGNISENPHIAILVIDFYRDSVGLHVNGKARIVENEELLAYKDRLPANVFEEINLEGKRRPERWIMVEVEEAYIQCSKHIPHLQKLERKIDWGTDSVAAKKGDYFQLQDIPLYHRVGGDKAMDVVVDVFYRKVLQDELVGRFFEDVDMEGQRLKQKSFLAMAFGGPYQYSGLDLRKAHGRLVEQMGLTDEHFDRVATILKETLEEVEISNREIDEMLAIIESARDDILNR